MLPSALKSSSRSGSLEDLIFDEAYIDKLLSKQGAQYESLSKEIFPYTTIGIPDGFLESNPLSGYEYSKVFTTQLEGNSSENYESVSKRNSTDDYVNQICFLGSNSFDGSTDLPKERLLLKGILLNYICSQMMRQEPADPQLVQNRLFGVYIRDQTPSETTDSNQSVPASALAVISQYGASLNDIITQLIPFQSILPVSVFTKPLTRLCDLPANSLRGVPAGVYNGYLHVIDIAKSLGHSQDVESPLFSSIFCSLFRVSLARGSIDSLLPLTRFFLPHIRSEKLISVEESLSSLVKDVSGATHSFDVYASGRPTKFSEPSATFSQITPKELSDVKQAVAGDEFVLMLTESKSLYVGGVHRFIPVASSGSRRDRVVGNKSIRDLMLGIPVVKICPSSSGSSMLVIGEDGSLYAFGNNNHSMLGVGSSQPFIATPTRVNFPSDVCIVNAACGRDHSIACDKNGHVWAWGNNSCFQCGFESVEDKDIAVPTLIPGLNDIIDCVAGDSHTLFLNNERQLYACGFNNCGQLGISTSASSNTLPVLIHTPSPVQSIACGCNHSLILCVDGRVYGCGDNSLNQILYPSKKDTQVVRSLNSFTRIPVTSSSSISHVFAGQSSSGAVTASGVAYVWGENNDFKLTDLPSPFTTGTIPVSRLTSFSQPVVSISISGSFAVALSRSRFSVDVMFSSVLLADVEKVVLNDWSVDAMLTKFASKLNAVSPREVISLLLTFVLYYTHRHCEALNRSSSATAEGSSTTTTAPTVGGSTSKPTPPQVPARKQMQKTEPVPSEIDEGNLDIDVNKESVLSTIELINELLDVCKLTGQTLIQSLNDSITPVVYGSSIELPVVSRSRVFDDSSMSSSAVNGNAASSSSSSSSSSSIRNTIPQAPSRATLSRSLSQSSVPSVKTPRGVNDQVSGDLMYAPIDESLEETSTVDIPSSSASVSTKGSGGERIVDEMSLGAPDPQPDAPNPPKRGPAPLPPKRYSRSPPAPEEQSAVNKEEKPESTAESTPSKVGVTSRTTPRQPPKPLNIQVRSSAPSSSSSSSGVGTLALTPVLNGATSSSPSSVNTPYKPTSLASPSATTTVPPPIPSKPVSPAVSSVPTTTTATTYSPLPPSSLSRSIDMLEMDLLNRSSGDTHSNKAPTHRRACSFDGSSFKKVESDPFMRMMSRTSNLSLIDYMNADSTVGMDKLNPSASSADGSSRLVLHSGTSDLDLPIYESAASVGRLPASASASSSSTCANEAMEEHNYHVFVVLNYLRTQLLVLSRKRREEYKWLDISWQGPLMTVLSRIICFRFSSFSGRLIKKQVQEIFSLLVVFQATNEDIVQFMLHLCEIVDDCVGTSKKSSVSSTSTTSMESSSSASSTSSGVGAIRDKLRNNNTQEIVQSIIRRHQFSSQNVCDILDVIFVICKALHKMYTTRKQMNSGRRNDMDMRLIQSVVSIVFSCVSPHIHMYIQRMKSEVYVIDSSGLSECLKTCMFYMYTQYLSINVEIAREIARIPISDTELQASADSKTHSPINESIYNRLRERKSQLQAVMNEFVSITIHIIEFSTELLERSQISLFASRKFMFATNIFLKNCPINEPLDVAIILLQNILLQRTETTPRSMLYDVDFDQIMFEFYGSFNTVIPMLSELSLRLDTMISIVNKSTESSGVQPGFLQENYSLIVGFASIFASLVLSLKDSDANSKPITPGTKNASSLTSSSPSTTTTSTQNKKNQSPSTHSPTALSPAESTASEEADNAIESALLLNGLINSDKPSGSDNVYSLCYSLLMNDEVGQSFFTAIQASKKLSKMQERIAKSNGLIMESIRCVTAAYLWHSPSVHLQYSRDISVTPAVLLSYNSALKFLQHINHHHQQNGWSYEMILEMMRSKAHMLLLTRPMWLPPGEFVTIRNHFPPAYQVLKSKGLFADDDHFAGESADDDVSAHSSSVTPMETPRNDSKRNTIINTQEMTVNYALDEQSMENAIRDKLSDLVQVFFQSEVDFDQLQKKVELRKKLIRLKVNVFNFFSLCMRQMSGSENVMLAIRSFNSVERFAPKGLAPPLPPKPDTSASTVTDSKNPFDPLQPPTIAPEETPIRASKSRIISLNDTLDPEQEKLLNRSMTDIVERILIEIEKNWSKRKQRRVFDVKTITMGNFLNMSASSTATATASPSTTDGTSSSSSSSSSSSNILLTSMSSSTAIHRKDLTVKKEEEKQTDDSYRTIVECIASITFPYSPFDCEYLSKTRIISSLHHIWSMGSLLCHSESIPVIKKPLNIQVRSSTMSNTYFAISGKKYPSLFMNENEGNQVNKSWIQVVPSMLPESNIRNIVITKSFVFLLGESGKVYKMDESKQIETLVIPLSISIIELVGSFYSDSLLLRTSTNMVLVYGDNTYGQLSCKNESMITQIRGITGNINQFSITKIAIGSNHTVFLTQEGSIWMSGKNEMGQLGNGTTQHSPVVFCNLNSSLRNIKYISCGENFTLMATSTSLYGCGDNSYGQLGRNPTQESFIPNITEIVLPRKIVSERIASIYAGNNHCAILTNEKNIYIWGSNSHGQLGLGLALDSCTYTPVLVENISVEQICLGYNNTLIKTVNNNILCCGENKSFNLGFESDNNNILCFYPSLNLYDYSIQSIYSGGMNGYILQLCISNESLIRPLMSVEVDKLKSQYCSWLLTNILLVNCSYEQTDVSSFVIHLRDLLLQEILLMNIFINSNQFGDEWSVYSPISLPEANTAYYKYLLKMSMSSNVGKSAGHVTDSSLYFKPFMYIGQILSLLLKGCKHSMGLVKSLCNEQGIQALIPLFISLLNVYEMLSTSNLLQASHLSNKPYTTPVLMCIKLLVDLLSLILPLSDLSLVDHVILNHIPSRILNKYVIGLPRQCERYLFITILLHTMGRTILIPLGPAEELVPSPYYCRIIASYCQELCWSLIPSNQWSSAFNFVSSTCLGISMNFQNVLMQLSKISTYHEDYNSIYLLSGCISLYGGLPTIYGIGSKVTLTIGTLQQDGLILLFRDSMKSLDWKGQCLVKVQGSKDIMWIKKLQDLNMIQERLPIDSFTNLSRVFDSYILLFNGNKQEKKGLASVILSRLQQMTMYSIMNLFMYPKAASIALNVLKDVLKFLHINLPTYFSGANLSIMQMREEELETLWKLQIWEVVKHLLVQNKQINYEVNTWPPVIPDDMWRCNICSFGSSISFNTCSLCGTDRKSSLHDVMKKTADVSPSISSSQNATTPTTSRSGIGSEVDTDSMSSSSPSSASLLSTQSQSGLSRPQMKPSVLTRKVSQRTSATDFARESETICLSFVFNNQPKVPAECSCSFTGNYQWCDVVIAETQKNVPKLNGKSSIRLTHNLGLDKGNGGGIYLNVYSIIMDVIIPDFSTRDYTCIFQSDPTNKHPGSLFIRRDGSIGCVKYSQPNVIRDTSFHRIILSVNLPNRLIEWYVDGVKQGYLSKDNEFSVPVEIDDRWSLDDTFIIGCDCDESANAVMFVSCIQIRNKIINDTEAKEMGIATMDGIPEPSATELMYSLVKSLRIPYAFVSIALENVEKSSPDAVLGFITENESKILQFLLNESTAIERLGYPRAFSRYLVFITGHRENALKCIDEPIEALAASRGMTLDMLNVFLSKLDTIGTESSQVKATHLAPWSSITLSFPCCNSTKRFFPGCTIGEGRSNGGIIVGNRVKRGPNWKWGNQDEMKFGTVRSIVDWDKIPYGGVVVEWDGGKTNKYRWGPGDNHDLIIIGELAMMSSSTENQSFGSVSLSTVLLSVEYPKNDSDQLSSSSSYVQTAVINVGSGTTLSSSLLGGGGGGASGANDSSSVDMQKAGAKDTVDVKQNLYSLLPSMIDLHVQELYVEAVDLALATTQQISRRAIYLLMNTSSRLSHSSTLLSIVNPSMGISSMNSLSLTPVELSSLTETIETEFQDKSLFKEVSMVYISSLLSDYGGNEMSEKSDSLNVLQKEVSNIINDEILYANYYKYLIKDSVQLNSLWKKSFTKRLFLDLLSRMSVLFQPVYASSKLSLSLTETKEYVSLGAIPERSVRFWRPKMDGCVALSDVMLVQSQSVSFSQPTEKSLVVKAPGFTVAQQMEWLRENEVMHDDGGASAYSQQQQQQQQQQQLSGKSTNSPEINELIRKSNVLYPKLFVFITSIDTVSSGTLFFWRIAAPLGFVGLGSAVTKSPTPPELKDYVTIRSSLVEVSTPKEKSRANAVLHTAHRFWEMPSELRHFYITFNALPPDPNCTFVLKGESKALSDVKNLKTMKWILQFFTELRINPRDPLGPFTPFVFGHPLLVGMIQALRVVDNSERYFFLSSMRYVLRQFSSESVGQSALLKDYLSEIGTLVDTIRDREKKSVEPTPMMQALMEVVVDTLLQLVDSMKHGYADAANHVFSRFAQNPFYLKFAYTAYVMEALINRSVSRLPVEFMFNGACLNQLIRYRDSVTLETEHPYTRENHTNMVHFDDATSISLRVSGGSCMAEDDVLMISTLNKRPVIMLSGHQPESTSYSLNTSELCVEFPVASRSFSNAFTNKINAFNYNAERSIVAHVEQNRWDTIHVDDPMPLYSISSYTFLIRKLARKNIVIGLACWKENDKLIGSDLKSWGLMGDGSVIHKQKVAKYWKDGLKEGDEVRVVLNPNSGTVSYYVNNAFAGLAFDDLSIMKSGYVCVSMYDMGDMIELVSSNCINLKSEKSGCTINDTKSVTEDSEYERWLAKVPAKRMNSAKEMSSMGFELALCVFALEKANDNVNNAIDYLLANTDELIQKADALLTSKKKIERENSGRLISEWLLGALCDSSMISQLQWKCSVCTCLNAMNMTTCSVCEGSKEGCQMIQGSHPYQYGYRIQCIPNYTQTVFGDKTSNLIGNTDDLLPVVSKFTLEQDESLVQLVAEFCYSQNHDPVTLLPQSLMPSDRLIMKHNRLSEFHLSQLQIRFFVLQQFNVMMNDAFPYINISCSDKESTLACHLRALRGLIFRATKNTWLTKSLAKTMSSDRNVASVDRVSATKFKSRSVCDVDGKFTIFGQMFTQLNKVPPSKLRSTNQTFVMQFKGEFGDDVGGLFREVFADMSKEIESASLPLFVMSPNGRNEIGQNRDVMIPNCNATTTTCLSMYEFLGKLIGISIRTQTPLVINIAQLFWKRLVNIPIDVQDIMAIDMEFSNRIASMNQYASEEEWMASSDRSKNTFTIINSCGLSVEMFAGGKSQIVSFGERSHFIELAYEMRLKEFDQQMNAVVAGLHSIVPAHYIDLFTAEEMKELVCGRADISVDLLKANTTYDGYTESSKVIQFFWKVLRSFSNEERELYLKFVWGRSRLPLDSSQFKMKHSIRCRRLTNSNNHFPVAHTCFFTLDLPEYSSQKILQQKLLYAIHNCQTIDGDATQRAGIAGRDLSAYR